jgi:hypothetical protein
LRLALFALEVAAQDEQLKFWHRNIQLVVPSQLVYLPVGQTVQCRNCCITNIQAVVGFARRGPVFSSMTCDKGAGLVLSSGCSICEQCAGIIRRSISFSIQYAIKSARIWLPCPSAMSKRPLSS